MVRTHRLNLRFVATLILILSTLTFADSKGAKSVDSKSASASFMKMPLAFEPNVGQADGQAKFVSRGAGYSLYVNGRDAFFSIKGKDGKRQIVKLSLTGADANAPAQGLDQLPGTTSYFLGNDPAKWHTGITTFRKAHFSNVYRGVDLLYYGSNGLLEYDYRVAPNADTKAIAMKIAGAKKLRVDPNGDLVLTLKDGEIRLQKPVAYQEKNGERQNVEIAYAVKGKDVRFTLGAYDKGQPLVIDPVFNFLTYLGGANALSAKAIVLDSSSNIYVTGSTTDTTFGTASNGCAACGGRGGSNDIFVAKLNNDGSAVSYLAVVGGDGTDDAKAIAVDASNNAYVVGQTTSTNFPTSGTNISGVQGATPPDGFIFELNATGTSLSYGTYLHGGAGDGADSVNGVIARGGFIYVGGSTASSDLFPSGLAITQGVNAGNGDGFVLKIDPSQAGTAAMKYASYVGAGQADSVNGIAATGNASALDDIFVVGTTNKDATASANIGGSFAGTGTVDAFVVQFRTTDAAISDAYCAVTDVANKRVKVTTSTAHGLATGDVFAVTGVGNTSGGFVLNGPHTVTSAPDNFTIIYADNACLAAVDNQHGVIGGSSRATGVAQYAKTYGGDNTTTGAAIAVNSAGLAHFAGATTSTTSFPATGTLGGTQDGYVAQVNASGALNWSTYIGGSGVDAATAIAVDSTCAGTCRVYVAGNTQSGGSNFNNSAGQTNLSGTQDGFVARYTSAGALSVDSYVGGSGVDAINGIAADFTNFSFYIAGDTTSTDLTTVAVSTADRAGVTSSAFQTIPASAPAGTQTGFIAKYTANTSAAPVLTLAGVANPTTAIGQSGTFASTVTYTFTVNKTSGTPTNTTFDVRMPQNGSGSDFLTITGATPSQGSCSFRAGNATAGPGGATCQLGTISGATTVAINATATNLLNCTTAVCSPATVTLQAKAASAESPGASNPKFATASSTVGSVVDLTVSGTGGGNVSGAGTNNFQDGSDTVYTYVLSVTNPQTYATDATATITLTFVYPTQFSPNVALLPVGCLNNGGTHTITCTIAGGIAAGATVQKSIAGANPSFPVGLSTQTFNGTLTATGSASNSQVFVTSTNNQNVTVAANYIGPTADLGVTSIVATPGGPVNVGTNLSYQVNYTSNAASLNNANATVTITFNQAFTADAPLPTPPGGTICIQSNSTTITCPVGTLNPGNAKNFTFTGNATLANTSQTATLTATAVISSSNTQEPVGAVDSNTANSNVTVNRTTALTLGTLTAPATSSQNANIQYSLPISNGGPNTAQTVVVRFAPTNAGTYSLSGSTGASCAINGAFVDCTVNNITTAGTTITMTITPDPALLTGLASKVVSTTASITSAASVDAGVPSASSNAATTTVQRQTALNLSAATLLPNPTTQTGNIVFHVQVDNTSGVNTATNVTLNYTFPANYNFVSINVGSCVTNAAAGTAACNIGSVTTGAPVNVNLTFTPPAGFVPTTSKNATLNAQIGSVGSTEIVDGAGTKSTAVLSTLVERRANLGLTTYAVSPTPSANDGVPLTYTISGGNSGPDTAFGAQVVLDFTAVGATGFNLGTDTAPGGCLTTTATQVTCQVGTLTNGSTFSFTVIITPPNTFLGSSASKSWTSTATVSGAVQDNTSGNDVLNRNVTIQAQADLFGSVVESADPTNLNSIFTYTVAVGEKATVSGGGTPTPANNARVTFTMPRSGAGPFRTFTASSIIPGNFTCTVGGVAPTFPIAPNTTVVCELLSTTLVPGGATQQVVFVGDPAFGGGVNLPPLEATNSLNATATIDTNGPTVIETNAADNNPTASTTLQRNANMSIGVIQETPNGGNPGDTYIEGTNTSVLLSIPINNAGPDNITAANQVNLSSATLPAGTTFNAGLSDPSCSILTLVVTCTNVAVPAGGGTTINVSLTPPSSSGANGTFITTWNVSTGAPSYNDPNTGNNNGNSTVTIQRQGNVGVAIAPIIPVAGYVVAGPNFSQKVVYSVTVSASTPGANAANVPVSIVLPSGTTGITTTIVAPNTCTPASNTVNCNIQTLNAGTSVTFQVSGVPLLPITQADDPGVTATVSINPNSLNLIDQNATDDSATSAGIPLRGESDVQLSITSPPTPVPNRSRPSTAVAAGDDLTYTITVLASGAAGMHPAKNLTVNQIQLPTNTTLNSVTSAVFSCPGGTMPCTLPQLSQNNPVTITVSVHIPAAAVPTQPTTLGYQINATTFNQPDIPSNDTETAGNNNNNNLTPSGAGAFTSVAEQTSDMAVSVPNPGLLQPGVTGHFMITVSNVGTLNPSTGTVVTIPIAASPLSNSSVASGTPSQGSCGALSGGGTSGASITCNLGAIAVGANATIDLAVTPSLPGQVQITPSVAVSNVDPNAGNNSASATLLTGNTPAGINSVPVQPANSTTGVAVPGVLITFTGNSTLNAVSPPGGNTTADVVAGTSPLGFRPPIAAFSIGTTAVFNPTFTPMCVTFSTTITKPERVRFFANGSDVTIAAPAPATYNVTSGGSSTVCGDVSSMNPAIGPGSVNVVIAEPQNSAPTAVASNTSSAQSGKGLTGAGVTLDASASFDDSNKCTSGVNVNGTCSDLSNALLTWTGQFTDGNQKQVQCSGVGGPTNLAANPPLVPAGTCLTLGVSVPFGQQNVTLVITDPYGVSSTPVTTAINSTASAGGSTTGSVTVNAGQSASYSVNAKGGGGTTTVSIISIVTNTSTISCSVTPSSFPGTGTISVNVGCSTQAPVFAKAEPLPPAEAPMLAGAIGITALPLIGMLLLPGRNRRQKRMKVLAILGLLMLMTLFMGACGGGGKSGAFGGSTTLQSAGTPKGTYTITLGATGGQFATTDSMGNTTFSSTKTLTLVVQ